MRRFWTRTSLRAMLAYVIAAVLLGGFVVISGREIHDHIGAIEAWLTRLGPWGVVIFVGLAVLLTSIFVPETLLAIIAGALFGLVGGMAAIVVSALLAATVQYALSRQLLRNRIERALAGEPSLRAVQNAVLHQELRLQVLIRLTPLSPTVTNYVLGAAGVRFPGFLLAALALMPGLCLEVYFGHAGKHVVGVAGRSGGSTTAHDALVLGGLLTCVVVIVCISRMARKAVQAAVDETRQH